ncbi:hypothetical protein MPH47_17075 [Psychrobacillus psychrodurans]|uniref:SRPBCC family protein n=1 Tax=Psychrobacillus psychrodurans TaxID=126157 RepID=UPI001F4E28F6|nr:hypothetical protein [Psychrobacillus psychrodurans]MCK1998912.1 hypothetical protein [Psychrobacillus psychrodurans]
MNSTSNATSVKKQITIHAPLNLVWYAWTLSERVSEWFAPETIIEGTQIWHFRIMIQS